MTLQDLLRSKVAQIFARAEHGTARRLASAADDLPGVGIRAEGGEVRFTGRRLRRRALADPRLRWPGAWLRSFL